MKPTARTRRPPRSLLALIVALAVCLATPMTALAADYTVGSDAGVNDWASYGGTITLGEGDTLTIDTGAADDANGTEIVISTTATGIAINSDGFVHTGLYITVGDGAEFSMDNLRLTAPSAPQAHSGITVNGDATIAASGTCVISGSGEGGFGLLADGDIIINNSGDLAFNAGDLSSGIYANSIRAYNGTGTMIAQGSGGAGIVTKGITQNGGTITAIGDTGSAGISSPGGVGTSLGISVNDGTLSATGKGDGPGISSGRALIVHNNGSIYADSDGGNGLDVETAFTYGGTGELHVSAGDFGIICRSFTQNGGMIDTLGEVEEGVYVTDGSILTVTAGTLTASSNSRLGINFDEAPPHTIVMGVGARVEILGNAGADRTYTFRQDPAGNTWNGTDATITGNPTDTTVTYTIADGKTGIITLAAANLSAGPGLNPNPANNASGGGYPAVWAHDTTPPIITASSATPVSETAAALSVRATDPSQPLSYQWQDKQPDNTWANIPGATQADFDYALLQPGKTYTVRCRVADAYGNAAYTKEMTFTLGEFIEAVEENPFPCTGVVIANSVNVRPDPSTKGKALGKAYKNDELTLLGYVAPQGSGAGFYEVAWDNAAGYAYISADHVRAMFGAPLPAAIGGKVYAQTKMSTSGKARAATFSKGDGVQLVGRDGKWWMIDLGGQIRYVQNGKYVQPVQY